MEAKKARLKQGGIRKRGLGYEIDWYEGAARRRVIVRVPKRMAEEIRREKQVEADKRAVLGRSNPETITFEKFAQMYMDTHAKPNKRSWKSTDEVYLKRLIPVFGGYNLHSITPKMIEDYKVKRALQVSQSHVDKELTCLKTIFNKAISWDYFVNVNPLKKVKFFKVDNTRYRYLNEAEIEKLLSACNVRLKPFVLIALHTGMRRGEISSLEWREINFEQGHITIDRTKSKSKRTRIVPINDVVKKELMAIAKHPTSPYVFHNEEGCPSNFREAFDGALERAEIKDFRFHDLRHTFASHLAMLGISLHTIADLLGHSSTIVTKRYSHLSPDHKSSVVEKLVTLWSHGKNVVAEPDSVVYTTRTFPSGYDLSPGGEIGRRNGLKIRRGFKHPCRFNSGPGHQSLKRDVCYVPYFASSCGVGFTTPPQSLACALDSAPFERLVSLMC